MHTHTLASVSPKMRFSKKTIKRKKRSFHRSLLFFFLSIGTVCVCVGAECDGKTFFFSLFVVFFGGMFLLHFNFLEGIYSILSSGLCWRFGLPSNFAAFVRRRAAKKKNFDLCLQQ